MLEGGSGSRNSTTVEARPNWAVGYSKGAAPGCPPPQWQRTFSFAVRPPTLLALQVSWGSTVSCRQVSLFVGPPCLAHTKCSCQCCA